ncbi:hypothetical protein BKA70DRAFT_1332615 [Coprinopsis sp. MPI-PUGE-AT-0042]|nr:hypothetical protein BKA70DRAFT_1332615 [Coprinopsis sp. MPI-PUGE-AT-0042]
MASQAVPEPKVYVTNEAGKQSLVDESGLVPIPPLPLDWDKPESNYWILGWAVKPSVAADALARGWDITEVGGDTALLYMLLRDNIDHEPLSVISAKPDAQAEADGVVVDIPNDLADPDGPSTPAVQVLFIVSTVSAKRYTQRPTQEDYTIMVDLLGEPRWFQCHKPKKGFKKRWLDWCS